MRPYGIGQRRSGQVTGKGKYDRTIGTITVPSRKRGAVDEEDRRAGEIGPTPTPTPQLIFSDGRDLANSEPCAPAGAGSSRRWQRERNLAKEVHFAATATSGGGAE